MINMLHRLVLNSLNEFDIALREHLEFTPSERRLELPEVDTTLEEPRPEGSPQV